MNAKPLDSPGLLLSSTDTWKHRVLLPLRDISYNDTSSYSQGVWLPAMYLWQLSLVLIFLADRLGVCSGEACRCYWTRSKTNALQLAPVLPGNKKYQPMLVLFALFARHVIGFGDRPAQSRAGLRASARGSCGSGNVCHPAPGGPGRTARATRAFVEPVAVGVQGSLLRAPGRLAEDSVPRLTGRLGPRRRAPFWMSSISLL